MGAGLYLSYHLRSTKPTPQYSIADFHCIPHNEEVARFLIRDWLPHSRFYGYASRHWRRSPLIGLQFSAFLPMLFRWFFVLHVACCLLLHLHSWFFLAISHTCVYVAGLFNLLRTPRICICRPLHPICSYSIHIYLLKWTWGNFAFIL